MIDEQQWDSVETLHARFGAARAASRAEPAPDWATRRDRLQRLSAMLREGEGQVIRAISADFGHRAEGDTRLAEIFPSHVEIAHALRHGKGWMKPRRVPTPIWFRPARSVIVPQPKGTDG